MNREIIPAPSFAALPGIYHAEVSSDLLDPHGQLIDWVISFAFETLGASRLDLRVTPSNRFQGEPYPADARMHSLA
jgi:hypothetical protein